MALLNSHKLTLYKRTNRNNSFLKRRRKVIAKIDEQILLATDSNYKPTKIKWVPNEDGTERKLEIPKRIVTLVIIRTRFSLRNLHKSCT